MEQSRKEDSMAVQKVWIEDTCTACQLCVNSCPDVFEMGDEYATVIKDADLNTNESCLREAADDCPVASIKVE
jgi:ferredoxin